VTDAATGKVPDFYDLATQLIVELTGENFHQGYWYSEQDASSYQVATDRLTDLLVDRSGLFDGGRVLDVGCGIGLPAFRLAELTPAEIVGISNNQPQIDEANRRAVGRGLADRVTFQHADAHDLPFPDDSFDVVWAFEVMLHLDRKRAFQEILRVLRPGGRLVVTDQLQTGPFSEQDQPVIDQFLAALSAPPLLDAGQYRDLLTECGLEVVELRDVSAETGRTGRWVTEAVNERFEEIVGKYGQEVAPILEAFRSPVVYIKELGYLVAVARRA
jgi:ubiquinone/menaquinone biosynthesis C-methylase UbiE